MYKASYTGYGDYVNVNVNVSGYEVTSDLAWLLPGVNEWVECPNIFKPGAPRLDEGQVWCAVHGGSIMEIVQHLNDTIHWTREQVADWLDTLDVDLTFPTEPPPRPEPRLAIDPPPWSPKYEVPPHWSSVETTDDNNAWLTVASFPKSGKVMLGPGAAHIVIDDLHAFQMAAIDKFFKDDLKTSVSLDVNLPWLVSLGKDWLGEAEEPEAIALDADPDAPDLLKRPDGTPLPDLSTDVWLDAGDGSKPTLLKGVKIHPDVAAKFGLKKSLPQPTPPAPNTENVTHRKKGKHRGKHRRS